MEDIGGRLYLNGVEYNPGTLITEVGNYTLEIKGSRYYSKTIHFQIRHTYEHSTMEHLQNPINLRFDAREVLVNDQEVKGTYRIGKTGTYKVVVNGAGDYTETYWFTYVNPNDQYVPYANIVAYSMVGIVSVIYSMIFIRRRK